MKKIYLYAVLLLIGTTASRTTNVTEAKRIGNQ